jgi:histone H3/H4
MAKKKAAKKSNKEVLVVASKVKAYIKSKGMMTSSDAIGALNECVYECIDAAIARTKANKRSTVKPQDL